MPEAGATSDPLAGDTIRSADVALREALITGESPRWLSGLDFSNVGLAAQFSSGYVWVAGLLSKFGSPVSKTLTGSATNYVYADGQGNVIVNTTGVQPAGTVLLYTIVCGASAPTATTDLRDSTMSLTVPHQATQYTATAPVPTAVGHLTRKDYVDAAVLTSGIRPVRFATVTNDTLSGLAVRDGVTPAAGDRVLVKAQNTANQNGVYVAASGAWARASDVIYAGSLVQVSEGTAGALTSWIVTTTGVIVLDTTSLSFGLFSVQGQFGTANGIATLSGGTHTLAERPYATSSVRGAVTLSVAPVSSTAPIAVGDNDSRMANSRAPTGSAGGDLGGSYPSPTVAGLGGQALPTNVGDGFLKRNAANGAWEEVGYGLVANAVMQGSTRLDQVPAPSASVSLNSQRAINAADPISAQDLVTKAYVDAVKQGLDPKDSVRVATVGSNVTVAGGAPNTLDGVSLALNDRILVKDQTTGSQNGIYYVSTLGTGANGTWARATDADTSAKVTSGMYTFVTEGTVNDNNGFVLTTNDPIVLGTTGLTFTQFSGAGQVIAGSGLSKTGNQLDVNVDGSTIEVVADALQTKDGGQTNAKLANMAAATVKGRASGAGTGVPVDLTASQLLTIIETVDGAGSGLDADLVGGKSLDAAATVDTVVLRGTAGRIKAGVPVASDDVVRVAEVSSGAYGSVFDRAAASLAAGFTLEGVSYLYYPPQGSNPQFNGIAVHWPSGSIANGNGSFTIGPTLVYSPGVADSTIAWATGAKWGFITKLKVATFTGLGANQLAGIEFNILVDGQAAHSKTGNGMRIAIEVDSAGKIFVVCASGSGVTATDTGVVATTGVAFKINVAFTLGTSVVVTIDEGAPTTVTTNLPTRLIKGCFGVNSLAGPVLDWYGGIWRATGG